MRELLVPAVLAAAAAAAAEAAAVALGWSPSVWLVAGAVVAVGCAAFLVAGRRRALRRQARRRARADERRQAPAFTTSGTVRRVAPGTGTAAAARRGGRPPG